MTKKKRIILTAVLAVVAVIVVCVVGFLESYSRSEPIVDKYLISSQAVRVKEIDNYYYFDGPGEENAIIFYPGAKIETKSYAPLVHYLAENGVDCFLVKVPCNIAFFGSNDATKIIDKYSYDNWYMCGHSMGGAVAAIYTANNASRLKGVILLAAYPTKKIPDSIKFLSIYGSQDGVLKMDKYNECKQYWSANSTELVIEGGNHAQFGYYGKQKKDNDASISAEEQQKQTLESIIKFIKK